MPLVRVDWVAKRLDLHVVRPGSRKHRRALLSSFSGKYVASMNGYWPRVFRCLFSSGGSEELRFAIRSGVG